VRTRLSPNLFGTIPLARCALPEPDQRTGVWQDGTAGAHACQLRSSDAGVRADGRYSDRYDARRLAQYGFPVQQITTGGTCHLDARMIEKHLAAWDLDEIDLLFIEKRRKPCLPIELRSGRGVEDCAAERDRGRRQNRSSIHPYFLNRTSSSSPRLTCCPMYPSVRRWLRRMRGWCIPASRSCARPRRPKEGWMHGSPG